MNNLKTFEQFSNEKVALIALNEGIFDFMSKDEVTNSDIGDLKKSQDDILNKYELSDVARDNIRSKISDAISKKTGEITSPIESPEIGAETAMTQPM